MTPERASRWADILFGLLVAVGLLVCYVLREQLLLIYAAIVFSIVFAPAIQIVQRIKIGRWHPNRGAAVLILIGAVTLVFAVLGAFLIPSIASDLKALGTDVPGRAARIQSAISKLPFGSRLAEVARPEQLEQHVTELLKQLFGSIQAVASQITSLLLLAVMTAYFMVDGPRAFAWMISLLPRRSRAETKAMLTRASDRMERWLVGQGILMLVLASSSFIVFWALGIRYFYALAVFAGLANFVPILGPIATVIIASVIAALDGWTKVVGVLIFYAIYQQIESAYLTPRIMKSTVDLPGVTVVVALMIGGALGGPIGAVIAVPSAALISEVIEHYAHRREHPSESVEPEHTHYGD